ncbi:MAG: MATE family efflux transporter [Pseudomonadota bacterium]
MSHAPAFTQGSVMRHVVVMSSTASVGLMTLFVVDLVDMYFLSLLGETALAAAIGFAGSVLFFTTSINIGIAIAAGALVSRSLGAEEEERARDYAVHTLLFGVVVSMLLSAAIWSNTETVLQWLGAKGRALELANNYLKIVLPSMFVLCLGMTGGAILRAAGDAKRAMYSTVAGGLVNAGLDPIFIFGFNWGIEGAAWASVAARFTVMAIALGAVHRVHRLFTRFRFITFRQTITTILGISLPAMLTNVATPFGNAYVMASIADFGDSAVAGMSVIGRVIPVAFGVVFALSGAVGPIIGQNYGAQKMDRVRRAVIDGLIFGSAVVLTVCVILFFAQSWIVTVFSATGHAAALIAFFCTWIAISFLFNGIQFVSNAAFNNLGVPHYSTLTNIAKATVGTVPFVFAGALIAGAEGVLAGRAIGTALVAVAALWLCLRQLTRLESHTDIETRQKKKPFNPKNPLWPQSNTNG